MTREELAFWVAVVATAVTFVQVVPQIVRLIRTGNAEGVSPAWAAGGLTINLAWVTYVAENGYWEAIVSIVAAIVSFSLALFLLWRAGAQMRGSLWMIVAIAVGSVLVQRVFGWDVLGTVLGLSNALYLGPAMIAAWRTEVPVGVAPGTWWLTVAEGVKWGFYGFLVEAVPIMVYGVTAILLAALVLLRLWLTRDRILEALHHQDL